MACLGFCRARSARRVTGRPAGAGVDRLLRQATGSGPTEAGAGQGGQSGRRTAGDGGQSRCPDPAVGPEAVRGQSCPDDGTDQRPPQIPSSLTPGEIDNPVHRPADRKDERHPPGPSPDSHGSPGTRFLGAPFVLPQSCAIHTYAPTPCPSLASRSLRDDRKRTDPPGFREQGDLERRGVQHQEGNQRQCPHADGTARCADRVGAPQLPEVLPERAPPYQPNFPRCEGAQRRLGPTATA